MKLYGNHELLDVLKRKTQNDPAKNRYLITPAMDGHLTK
jgi:hypothetical protein